MFKRASFSITPIQVRKLTLGQVKRISPIKDDSRTSTSQSSTAELPANNQPSKISRYEPTIYRKTNPRDQAFKAHHQYNTMTEMQKIHTDKAFPGMLPSQDMRPE